MKKIVLSVFAILLLSVSLSAQNQRISGTVTSDDGSPIVGVTVILKGTSNGTITNAEGKYSITAPKDGILLFSFVGMENLSLPIAGKTTVDATMKSNALSIDNVVVTGYGTTQKAAFTGSAQAMDGKDLVTKTDANFMKAVQGSVAGLQMFNVGGQPGAFASVNIRGVGSVSSGTEPLYVIDGMPMYSDSYSALNPKGNGASFISPLASISSEDIESLTVLKDATATAIYGARAANGVIVITTKRGAAGTPKVTFNAKKGFTRAANLDPNYRTVNTEKYFDIWAKGAVNAGIDNTYEAGLTRIKNDAKNRFGWVEGVTPDTDWLDEIIRVGKIDDYSLNVTGGKSNTSYYISGGYMRNEGIVIGTGMDRYTMRSNVENKGKIVSFGLLSSASHARVNNSMTESQYSNPLVAVYDLRPIEPVRNPDGTYNVNAYYNPVALADEIEGDKMLQRTITANINPYVSLNLGKGFSAKSNFAMNIYNQNEDNFWSLNNPQGAESGGKGMVNNYTFLNMTITNTVNWMKSFDKHGLNLMLGQEAQRIRDEEQYSSASGYPYIGIKDMATAAVPTGATTLKKQSALNSWFFNGEYDLDDKYYLSGSMRYDGSSRFGKSNQWGLFYSLGAKYRISEEKFFEPLKSVINNLSLRTSFGTVGNQEIGWYSSRGLFEAGKNYNQRPGATVDRLPNNNLSWESRAKFNVGVDIRILDRINLEIDYYNEDTNDMIFDVPLSMTTGNTIYTKNVGQMNNSGIEILLNANILQLNGFVWNVNANFTANKNKITKLSTERPVESTTTIRKVGESYHTFFLKDYAGVDRETGQPMWYKGEEGNETTFDYNQAGQRVVGKADPKFYGGFGTTLNYKGFDLSFDFTYSYGNKVYNTGFAYDLQVGHYLRGPVSTYVYENAWTPENRDTDVPKFIWGNGSGANNESSRFLMDGSYLRLKSAMLGYTLPKEWITKIKMDNARIFMSADNLWTLRSKEFIGFDPEARATGMQSWVYPTATNVIFGVSFGF